MRKFIDMVLAFVLLLLVWQVASWQLDKAFLPTPLASFAAFITLLKSGAMQAAFFISAMRIVVSCTLAFVTAVPIGIVMARVPAVDRLLSPMVAVLYPLPKVVFLPILVVLFGLGNMPKILLISLIIFFQILVVVRDAVRNIPQEQFLAMYSLTTDPFAQYRHLILPGCLPDLLTALRVSVGTAIAVLFFAETFASFDGLGYLILDGMEKRAYPEMYAGIMGMGLLGLLLYAFFSMLESVFCNWRGKDL